MQIISFIMSVVMSVLSLFTPVAVMNEKTETQQKVDKAFSILMPDNGTMNPETRKVLTEILSNVLVEGLSGESESEDLVKLLDSIPVYEEGERNAERMDITVSPLKKAFGNVIADAIEGSEMSPLIKQFLLLLANGVYDMYIYFAPTEQEDVYVFCYDFADNNNNEVTVKTKACYNKSTGKLYGLENNGILGSGYDFEVKTYTVTTSVDVWMRDAGYTVLFDIVGNMGFINCDTARIEFEHGGKYWMFQLWKGNYAFDLINGCEIGIYNKTKKNSIMYDCATDEEMLNMSMKLIHGDDIIIERDETLHWWLCGLKFGTPISPDELLMQGTIEFEDTEMMNKFVEAAKEYSDEMTVSTNGKCVSIIWK